jgi:hypothetical protein
MKEITIPKKLEPIVRAFWADSEEAAKLLIIQAANAIYGNYEEETEIETFYEKRHIITEEELEGVCAMMNGFNPQDMLETILASQIVVTHLLGLRKLAKPLIEDQRLGLNMLRFSSEAMNQLQKKRSGHTQNISVTYNYNGTGQALMQTVLPNPNKPV